MQARLPRILGALVPLIVIHGCGGDPRLQSPAMREALDGFEGPAIESHMRALSADEMEGRGTGTRGYLRAADYVARRFEELGVQPAGEENGFYQWVPLMATSLDEERSRMELIRDAAAGPELIPGTDYVMRGDFVRERAEITAGLVWVGFGVTAPEFDHDDYADVDVTGRIVLLADGAPPGLPSDERAYYGSRQIKRRTAIEHGAVGMIAVPKPGERERSRWDRTVAHSRMASMRWADADGQPHDGFTDLLVDASLAPSGAAALFDGAGHTVEELAVAAREGRAVAFALPSRLRAETVSRLERLDSPNVVGLIPGADPELSTEIVALTTHLDHVGTGPPLEGEDGIYNGAYDNASGVAVLLEIARAFSELPQPPPRSVLFLAVTGEEKGLLGSDYFAHHPTVPPGAIVANVNVDMVMMRQPLTAAIAYGADHSTLGPLAAQAAERLGVRLVPDPIPEEGIFVRSDHYSFIRSGVPAVFLFSGIDDGFADWMHETYHTPGDDMNQAFDFESGADFARLSFLLTWLAAAVEDPPRWNADDFFGGKFGGPHAGPGS